MDLEGPAVAIARLRSTWDAQVRPSAWRALVALAFAVFLGAAHVARLGNPLPRAIAAGSFGLLLVGLVGRALVMRRRRADPRRVVRDTVARTHPELGAATLRALTLVDRTERDDRAGSPALAGLHLQRLLGRVSMERLGERASRSATRWSSAALALAAVGLGLVLFEPFRIIEGLDVVAASEGIAPLPLVWVDDVVMGATPPEYLHQQSVDVRRFRPTQQPRGTTLTVRGSPLHPGRRVVLTDGTTSVPFVDDGGGHRVARWTVADSTTLWIAAEFGDPARGGVRVRQPAEQAIVSIPDQAPRVTVEGAPRTVRLLDEPSIPIHYEATDDHGLREVDLVLRSGTREERRVLSHPAADVLIDRGGYELHAWDPFFKKAYVPVEITVEARDNDVVSGPKWGRSPAIVVIPPQVGEPEALRFKALRAARDAVVDLVAYRLNEKAPPAASAREHLTREKDAQAIAVAAVTAALAGSYGGLDVRGRFVSLSRGQLWRLARALDAEKKSPTAATHQKLLDETEDALLAFDAGLRGLGYRDAQAVARRLADVAEDAAAGLLAASSAAVAAEPTTARVRPAARVDAAVKVLDGGGKQLLELDELGRDLGRSLLTTCAGWPVPARPTICATPSWPPAIWPRACAGPSPRSAAEAGTGAGAAASSPGRLRVRTPASRRAPTRRPPPASATSRSWRASTRPRSATWKTRWSARSPPRSWTSSSRRPSSTPTPSARR